MKPLNLTGQRFHRLIVQSLAPKQGKKNVWQCLCDCGRASFAFVSDLTSGKHKSCGCLHLEAITKHGATKHGGGRSPEYQSWMMMRTRCTKRSYIHYQRYGGRGIKVCKRWTNSFTNFLADMGLRPTPKHTLERINNDGNYEPSNCRWATRNEQAQNRHYTPQIPRARDNKGRFR